MCSGDSLSRNYVHESIVVALSWWDYLLSGNNVLYILIDIQWWIIPFYIGGVILIDCLVHDWHKSVLTAIAERWWWQQVLDQIESYLYDDSMRQGEDITKSEYLFLRHKHIILNALTIYSMNETVLLFKSLMSKKDD